MAVKVQDRKESKINYDDNYRRLVDDANMLIEHDFGGDPRMLQVFPTYVKDQKEAIMCNINDIGTCIRLASSIVYPMSKSEVDARRDYQDKAIGLCYDTLTKYQLTMKILLVRDDKYTNEIKNLINEIVYLKNWRTSDFGRFKSVG